MLLPFSMAALARTSSLAWSSLKVTTTGLNDWLVDPVKPLSQHTGNFRPSAQNTLSRRCKPSRLSWDLESYGLLWKSELVRLFSVIVVKWIVSSDLRNQIILSLSHLAPDAVEYQITSLLLLEHLQLLPHFIQYLGDIVQLVVCRIGGTSSLTIVIIIISSGNVPNLLVENLLVWQIHFCCFSQSHRDTNWCFQP